MNIKYTGACKDFSGYGEAGRHDVAALLEAGVSVTGQYPSYVYEVSDFGKLGQKVMAVENKPLNYDIKILHTTPNIFPQYMEQGKYHIGRVFWETSRLPEDFAIGAQACEEIWTGSEYNKQAIISSGVTKKIYVIPEAIDTSEDIEAIKPYTLDEPDTFKFYSIFEWTERKNPEALLTAYWLEFEGVTDVSLNIKTYLDNFSSGKKEEIDQSIRLFKKKLPVSHYATVNLCRRLMDRRQVYRFHKTFDCFVSAHRGEGWGVPQMEAMLVGKPVISTNCGGIHEYLVDGKDALLMPYTLKQVENTRNKQWYTSEQEWADVDIPALRKAMRFMYEEKKQREEIAKSGQELVKRLFSLEAVGKRMLDRLSQIHL